MAESAADHLDALSALVTKAKAVPMSASCMINRSEVLALIDAARSAVSDELAAAKDAANASPPALERAKAEAEQLVRAAERKAKQLVDHHQILQGAKRRAAEVESRAIADTEGLRKEADLFVDGRIATMEAGLQKTLSQIQVMRSRLASRSGLDVDATTAPPNQDD